APHQSRELSQCARTARHDVPLGALLRSRVSYTPESPRLFFFKATPPTEFYTLSLHDALPIWAPRFTSRFPKTCNRAPARPARWRSEEHTSELQSRRDLVCRLLLEKKK